MARKAILGASLLILSMILVAGLLTNNTMTVSGGGAKTNPDYPSASLDPGFDGVKYMSALSPRTIDEYLSGKNETAMIRNIGTDVLHIDGPGGWAGQRFSTTMYNLFENRSYLKNSGFSSGTASPDYWSSSTNHESELKPTYDTVNKQICIWAHASINYNTGDNANWTQTIYVNRSSVQGAQLQFTIWRNGSNEVRLDATVYVNSVSIWARAHNQIQTSAQIIGVNLTAAQLPSFPGNLVITLQLSNPTGQEVRTDNKSVFFDDVYLYVKCKPYPESADLKIKLGGNSYPLIGYGYGKGRVSLSLSTSPPYDFTFTSNSTGVQFNCNSTVSLCRRSPNDTANFTAAQGPQVNQNVTKLSFFDSNSYIFGSTNYTRDIINVSIPQDWTYSGLIFPNGTLASWLRTGLIEIHANSSYSWIIMVNASGIRSYRPNPYTVMATSPNYLGVISTFRSSAGNWVAGDLFTNGTRIKINGTVQGDGRSKGSAHVVFYNATTNAVWRDMSPYPVTAGNDGNVSFNFKWSDNISGSGANVSRSDLITLVVWNNGSEVGVKWVPISFDFTPPQLRISGATPGQYVRATVPIIVSCNDAHPKNITLYIDGTAVANSTSSPWSLNYLWDTTNIGDGPMELKARAWDQVGHVNETKLIVSVDNTPPSLLTGLPATWTCAHGKVLLAISWKETHPKNVSLFVNGSFVLSGSGNLTYAWDTGTSGDGVVNLTITMLDLAGNIRRNTTEVIVDNTPPIVGLNLATTPQQVSGKLYVRGNITLSVKCADSNFKNVTLFIDGVATKNWTISNPSYKWNTTVLPDGVHTLAVGGWDLADNTNQTTLYTLYVDNTPPTVPGLLYPNQGDTVNATTPTLFWGDASDGAGSGVDHYILEIDTSPDFNSSNYRVENNVGFTNFTIPASKPLSIGTSITTWYWRVRAVDRVGNVGQYSSVRSFQVVPPAGLPVALILGVAGIAPAVAILSSVVLLRRRRKAEAEGFDRKSLIATYVFSKDGRCMFTHEFKEVKIEPQLLSGFLTAISNMMKEVIGGSGRALRTIERPDAKILLEFGDTATGALVTKKVSPEYRRRLKAFLSRFEHDYAGKISDWDGNEVFGDASEIVEEVFTSRVKVATYPTIVGIEDLLVDKKIGGVTISVSGKTGSGKSTFCLRHAASLLKRGHPVIIVDGSMPPKDLRKELTAGGVDTDKVEKEGLLILYDAYSEISGIESKEKHKLGSPGELNTINLSLSRDLGDLKRATVFFDSLTSMIEYSDLELAVDFIRTIKVKLSQGEHTAFFLVDSNAHDQRTLNYINHVMDGEIETTARRTKKGETERLVSFKRLNGFQIKTGYHQIQ